MTIAYAFDSQNIKQALDNIDDNFKSVGDMSIIIGENSADAPAYLAMMPIFMDNIKEYSIGAGIMLLDSKSIDTNKNLIIAGGPCANKLWKDFSDETCENWPYKGGQAIVRAVPNGEYTALLIAGTTKGDTLEIVRQLANYKSSGIFDEGLELVYTSKVDRSKEQSDLCKGVNEDFVCTYLNEFVRHTIKINDVTYKITLEKIYHSTDSIDLDIDGVKYPNVELRQSIELQDGVKLTPDYFHMLGDSVLTHLSEPYDPSTYGPRSIGRSKGSACSQIPLNQEHMWIRDEGNAYVTNLRTDLDNEIVDIEIDGEKYNNMKIGDKIDLDFGESLVFSEINKDINLPVFCFE
ncbi:MAG: hypothetical protein U9O94_09615 [Nanoarchaeota archaeon]|nr:hypothetical protein [Nanoarchaeota archaeon]